MRHVELHQARIASYSSNDLFAALAIAELVYEAEEELEEEELDDDDGAAAVGCPFTCC